jgi:hypothetical protein
MTDIQFSQLLEVISAAVVVGSFALGYLGGLT